MHKTRDAVIKKCSGTHNVPVEMVMANLHKIPVDVDTNMKCFMYCVQEGMQNFKDGKFDYDTTMKSIEMMPEQFQPLLKVTVEKCNKAINGVSDKCEAAFEFTKCFAAEMPAEFE